MFLAVKGAIGDTVDSHGKNNESIIDPTYKNSYLFVFCFFSFLLHGLLEVLNSSIRMKFQFHL